MSAVPQRGDLIDDYRIDRQLGSGAMGTVWLAEHVTLGRRVALKILAHQLAEDASFRDRFGREARLAARLDHPNVVPVYDAGDDPAGLWLAMRFVDGEDLRRRLRASGGDAPTLPAEQAVAVVEQVAAGLDHAHGLGIIHRDVKPANVLLEAATGPPAPGATQPLPGVQRVLLADFGLTKDLSEAQDLTQTGLVLGTVDYVAPEQIEGHAVDARADVYSLAAMLHVLLTGEPAFPGTTMAKLFAHVNARPPSIADLDDGLAAFEDVVRRGMAKDPDDRFASAGALAAAARAALEASGLGGDPTVALPAPARPVAPGGRPPAPRPRVPAPPVPPAADDGDPTRVARPGAAAARAAASAASPGAARSASSPLAAPTRVAPRRAAGAGGRPPVEYESPDGGRSRTLPLVLLGVLVLAVVVVGALGLRGGGGDSRADSRSDRTTTERRASTRTDPAPTETATTEAPTTTEETTDTAPSPDADGPVAVRGGGTLEPGDAVGDPTPSTPLAGTGSPARYVSSDGSWQTLVARPADDGWSTPTRTVKSEGQLVRLRQSGPDGRVLVVDYTDEQPATFDTRGGVLETRTLAGSVFGDVEGYRFRDARISSIPECATLTCVDVPLNQGDAGPGWGVLVAAPTASEAWASAERIVAATGPKR